MDLEPVKTIKPQEWMQTPQTIAVMEALGRGRALFVGGCVRNALLEKPVDDIDIATKLVPDEARRCLEQAGIKVIPTGIEHGTITAVMDGQGFEITTLRKDVATDGRRATIAFADQWEEDAQRRDFTMNTLLADCDGNIYDPLGCGLKDLEAGRIVFVGDPETRIAEDILRILRFFRFHGYYGCGKPDEAALQACKNAAHKIPELSKERITQEFFKILAIGKNGDENGDIHVDNGMYNPVHILGMMFSCGVLKDFVFQETDLAMVERLCNLQSQYHMPNLAAQLYALAGLSASNIEGMEKLLVLPKAIKKQMEAFERIKTGPALETERAVKVAVYHEGRAVVEQALFIACASSNTMPEITLLKIVQNWDIPVFPLTGEDLMKQGMKPGPELGAELKYREQAWIENGFK